MRGARRASAATTVFEASFGRWRASAAPRCDAEPQQVRGHAAEEQAEGTWRQLPVGRAAVALHAERRTAGVVWSCMLANKRASFLSYSKDIL